VVVFAPKGASGRQVGTRNECQRVISLALYFYLILITLGILGGMRGHI